MNEKKLRNDERHAKARELTRDDVLNPNYDYWAKMDHWSIGEAILLLHGIKPAKEVEKLYPSYAADLFFSDQYSALSFEQIDSIVLTAGEVLEPEDHDVMDASWELATRALKTRTLQKNNLEIYPSSFVKWATGKGLPIPKELVEAVRTYHKEAFEEPCNSRTEKVDLEPLEGKERQELGMLRQQKQKWEKAIEAAVDAVLFSRGKKLTRDELVDHLYPFELPYTTIDLIWKALRKKGLTKGPGRPTKVKNKNS